ncbi:hypothetical protein [Cysteiniphilum sp. 6C5]|uniref:hypothetical protein n=1 Tax=unclassified Cysteiniphilum TaxID=2610889 RepID=UPI003F86F0D4
MSKLTQDEFKIKFENDSLTNSEIIEYYELSGEYKAYKDQLTTNFTVSDKLLEAAKGKRTLNELEKQTLREQLFERMIIIDFIAHSKSLDKETQSYAYGVFISDLAKLRVSLSDMQGYNSESSPDGEWYKQQDYQFVSKNNEQAQQSLIRNQAWQQLENMWDDSCAKDLKAAALRAIVSNKNIDEMSEFKNLLKSISSAVETKLARSNSYLPKKVRSNLINRYLAEDVKSYLSLQLESLDLDDDLRKFATKVAVERVEKMTDNKIFQKTVTIEDDHARNDQLKFEYGQIKGQLEARANLLPKQELTIEPLTVQENNLSKKNLSDLQGKINENLMQQKQLTDGLNRLKDDQVALDEKQKEIDRIKGNIGELTLKSSQLDDKKFEFEEKTKIYGDLLQNYEKTKDNICVSLNNLKSEHNLLEDNKAKLEKQSALDDFYTECAKTSKEILMLQFNYTRAVVAKESTESSSDILGKILKYQDQLEALQNRGVSLGLNKNDPIICNLKLVAEAVYSYDQQVNNKDHNKLLDDVKSTGRSNNLSSTDSVKSGNKGDKDYSALTESNVKKIVERKTLENDANSNSDSENSFNVGLNVSHLIQDYTKSCNNLPKTVEIK